MLAVVVGEGIQRALVEGLGDLFEVLELGQVFHGVTHSVVHGEPAVNAQHHVGANASHNGVQDGVGRHQLHVDLDAALVGEGIIDHGLQHGGLVAASHQPNLDHVFGVLVVNVAQGVVVNEEGGHAGANLVNDAGEEVGALHIGLGLLTGDDDLVNVQLGLGHVLHGSTQTGDVILKVGEGLGDTLVAINELLQLHGQRLRGGNAVVLLAGELHGVVHQLVQALALQLHGFHNLRINLGDIVVTEAVGRNAGQHQHLAVDLVEAVDGVLHALEDAAHLAQRHFQADGVLASIKIEAIGRAGFIGQGTELPLGVISKGNGGHIVKGDLAVQINGTARQAAALIGLASLDGDIVVAVFGYFKIPLDPLTSGVPRIAADVVQHGVVHVVGNGGGRGVVVTGIQGGRRTRLSVFAFDGQLPLLCLVGHGDLRLSLQVVLVGLVAGNRHQRHAADDHRLVNSLEGELVLALGEIELVGFGFVAHVVAAIGGLILVLLLLGGTDIIALVVLTHLACIDPQAGEAQGVRASEGQHIVDVQLALHVHTAGLDGEVLQLNGVHTLLGNVDRPGGVVLVSGVDLGRAGGILLQLAIALERSNIDRDRLAALADGCMSLQIGLVGIITADTGNVGGQVCAFILVVEILRTLVQQHNRSNHDCHDQNADKNTPHFFPHKLATPVSLMFPSN